MALQPNFRVRGLKQVLRNAKRYGKKGEAAARYACYKKGNEIMGDAILITPKSAGGGHLRNSAYASKPTHSEKFCELGYGAAYAGYVHEMPQRYTDWTEPGTRNKFLQLTFNKHRKNLVDDIAKIIQREIKKSNPVVIQSSTIPQKPSRGEK